MRTVRFERESVLFENIVDPANVDRLEIAFCDLKTLQRIHRLTHLTQLHLYYCRSLIDISQLMRLRRLRQINLYCLPNVENGLELGVFRELESLSYNNISALGSIRGIEKLKKLSYLGLSRVKVLDGDFTPIIDCKSLQRVFWHGAPFPSPAMKEIRKLRPDILIGGNRARPIVESPNRAVNRSGRQRRI